MISLYVYEFTVYSMVKLYTLDTVDLPGVCDFYLFRDDSVSMSDSVVQYWDADKVSEEHSSSGSPFPLRDLAAWAVSTPVCLCSPDSSGHFDSVPIERLTATTSPASLLFHQEIDELLPDPWVFVCIPLPVGKLKGQMIFFFCCWKGQTSLLFRLIREVH